jgi:hypothetical protein
MQNKAYPDIFGEKSFTGCMGEKAGRTIVMRWNRLWE